MVMCKINVKYRYRNGLPVQEGICVLPDVWEQTFVVRVNSPITAEKLKDFLCTRHEADVTTLPTPALRGNLNFAVFVVKVRSMNSMSQDRLKAFLDRVWHSDVTMTDSVCTVANNPPKPGDKFYDQLVANMGLT